MTTIIGLCQALDAPVVGSGRLVAHSLHNSHGSAHRHVRIIVMSEYDSASECRVHRS
jgi:hypothetical protein